jgi:TolB-like protein/Tfp pilus assembly protein PilF
VIPPKDLVETDISDLRFGRFQLNANRRELSVDGVVAKLGARTFDVLLALVERRDRIVSKDELLKVVWPHLVVEENNLQVHVSSLRKLLGPMAIATIAGRGYRFTSGVEPADPQQMTSLASSVVPQLDDDGVSLAVLPFADLSPGKDQEYFADGLAEELLNVFCKVRGLRVISRTSAFSFRGTNLDIPAVAKKLNVGNVLEGSVRKVGKRVKVDLHLIHVKSDAPLWSESYDRELEDIFEVQEDIARAVVTELRDVLQPQSSYRRTYSETNNDVKAALRGRGQDAEAFRLYLQGRYLVDRLKSGDVTDGIKLLQQAVRIDPSLSLAWAVLSSAYVTLSWYELGDVPFSEAFRLGKEAAEMALSLEADLPEGHAALGWIRMLHDWDWSGADASFSRALTLAPTHAQSLRLASLLAQNLGRHQESMTLHLRAVALDPLNTNAHRNLGNHYLVVGQLDKAELAITKALALQPTATIAYFALGRLRFVQARFQEAREAFEKADGAMLMLGLAITYYAEGRQSEADDALAHLIDQRGTTRPCAIAQAYACRGEIDSAFSWLQRARELRDPTLAQVVWDPFVETLHSDPRWLQLLHKIGLAS